ncbi:MAG TPA: hypothetical protein EYH31_02895 [Anaerolineae bacterium]|nr:hypothetical protein [Anaerolineae bacterium]
MNPLAEASILRSPSCGPRPTYGCTADAPNRDRNWACPGRCLSGPGMRTWSAGSLRGAAYRPFGPQLPAGWRILGLIAALAGLISALWGM